MRRLVSLLAVAVRAVSGGLLATGFGVVAGAASAEAPCRATLEIEPESPWIEQPVSWRLHIESRPGVHSIEWIDAPAFPRTRAERVTVLPDLALDSEWKHRLEQRVLFPEVAGPVVLPESRLACVSGPVIGARHRECGS